MRLAATLGISLLALVISCTGIESPLSDTSWTLTALGPVSAPKPALKGHTADLSLFEDDGRRVAGYTGCNSFWGNYEADRESFTIAELFKQERGCPTDKLFEQESAMIDILTNAEHYSSSGSQLTIENTNGRILVFERRDAHP